MLTDGLRLRAGVQTDALAPRRYRDYDVAEHKRCDVFDFSESVAAFKTFVSGVEATGGGDEAEDVAGGKCKMLACNHELCEYGS